VHAFLKARFNDEEKQSPFKSGCFTTFSGPKPTTPIKMKTSSAQDEAQLKR
jgi:hypothetical protein